MYTQENLGKCRVCNEPASAIISKQSKNMTTLFSYCSFHAEIAKQFFGQSPGRTEIKGGFKLA